MFDLRQTLSLSAVLTLVVTPGCGSRDDCMFEDSTVLRGMEITTIPSRFTESPRQEVSLRGFVACDSVAEFASVWVADARRGWLVPISDDGSFRLSVVEVVFGESCLVVFAGPPSGEETDWDIGPYFDVTIGQASGECLGDLCTDFDDEGNCGCLVWREDAC